MKLIEIATNKNISWKEIAKFLKEKNYAETLMPMSDIPDEWAGMVMEKYNSNVVDVKKSTPYLVIELEKSDYKIEFTLRKPKNTKEEKGYINILESNNNDYKLGQVSDIVWELLKDNLSDKTEQSDLFIQIVTTLLKKEEKKRQETYAGLDDTEENDESEEYPYDPEKIRIDPVGLSVKTIKEFIDVGIIDLSPDFQRKFVWTAQAKKSRLIESLIIRIPLPAFYFSRDNDGVLQVVDGLQRLSVIRDFLNDELVLKDLEHLKDLNGKKYSELLPKHKSRVVMTQLTTYHIDPDTPPQVKFDLFKRLNEGGEPLLSQEIRNCMSRETTRDFIRNLVKREDSPFLAATGGSISSLRMADEELTLRFIAFYYEQILGEVEYKGNMEGFLNNTITILNTELQSKTAVLIEKRKRIEKAFDNAMRNAYYLFGNYAFRKIAEKDIEENARKQVINKALFTTWSILLSQYDHEMIKQLNLKDCLIQPIIQKIGADDSLYFDAITTGTNQRSKINTAFINALDIINKNLKTI